MFGLAQLLAVPLSRIFVGYDAELTALTCRAFRICSFLFLLAGINIYGSAFFTALNNGLISALISFLRTLVFQVAAVLIFPIFLKLDGVWLSAVAAELLSALFETLHPEPEGWLNSLLLNFSCPLKSKFCSNDSNNLVDCCGCSSSAAAGP